MLKKLLMLCVTLILSLSATLAAATVDVNTADQATLETIKGIGPVHAKAIVDERTRNGPFRNADDLAARVKGLGPKSVAHLEAAGLTINGSSAPPGGGTSAAKSSAASHKSSASTAPATPVTTPATTATTTHGGTPAAAPVAASGAKRWKWLKKHPAASAATSASAPAGVSGSTAARTGKTPKAKKAKKSKAASAAAASGT
jgi:competence protein ComEA